MEQKDLLRNLLIAGAAFLVFMAIGPRLFPTPPALNQPTTPPGIEQPAPAATGPDGAANPSTAPAVRTQGEGSGYTVIENTEEQIIVIGAHDSESETAGEEEPFRMRLALSNVGASIDSARLTDHAARLKEAERYTLLTPVVQSDGGTIRSLAVEKINIDGADVFLHDKKWTGGAPVRAPDGSGETVTFSIDVHKDGSPAMRVSRRFELTRQLKKEGRHDLNTSVLVENLSSEPRRVLMTMRGAVGVPQQNNADDRVVDWGVVAPSGHVLGNRRTQHGIAEKQSMPLYIWASSDPARRLSWAASANTYFTCTIAPTDPDGKSPASYITELTGFDVDQNPMTIADATVRFTSATVEVRPGGQIQYPASVYLGEKDGKAFQAIAEYSARNYYYQIEQGFGWCTFTFLVELMIKLLNGLFAIFRDYGVGIIILVLIVRALLHPITKKGQINMVRMQHKMGELAPKIEELKKKYANDRARLNQEMMKLDMNPAGQVLTCLPMFIQMPIWIALYLSLSNNIMMRHEPFLYGLTWIDDLTAQDALYKFSSPIHVPLFGVELTSFNLLPLLVGLFMYIQQKTQPKPKPNPNMTEQQRAQQDAMLKMMPIMSAMMVLIFYKMPSGLNLYVMFSSLFGWLEQVVIRKHIREQEAAGTLHLPSKRREKPDVIDVSGERRKPTWLEKLQKAAEDAQKLKSEKEKKKRK